MTSFLGRLRALFEGLAPRERLLVGGVGVLAAVLLVWLGALRPVASTIQRADRRAGAAEHDLERAVALRRELDEIQGRLTLVENRIQTSQAVNLFSILESLARSSAITVDSMEPQASPASDRYKETKVQVSLKEVTLAQVVTYLHRIETAPELLSIKSLRIRTRPDKPEVLNVTFTVSSFEPVAS